MIKFLDLKKQRDAFHNNLDEIILKVVEAGQFISGPEVKILESGIFYNWMKNNNKLGGQHKIPRLSNNRKYVEELLKMV